MARCRHARQIPQHVSVSDFVRRAKGDLRARSSKSLSTSANATGANASGNADTSRPHPATHRWHHHAVSEQTYPTRKASAPSLDPTGVSRSAGQSFSHRTGRAGLLPSLCRPYKPDGCTELMQEFFADNLGRAYQTIAKRVCALRFCLDQRRGLTTARNGMKIKMPGRFVASMRTVAGFQYPGRVCLFRSWCFLTKP
jgi:hypothetical protein